MPTATVHFVQLARDDVRHAGRIPATLPTSASSFGVISRATIFDYQTSKNLFGVHQHHYGLLGPDSPVDGLCTFNLASCLAIVVHCAETGKSALTHTPTNVQNWDCFKEQFEYVVAGGIGRQVDVVVLKGLSYTPGNTIRYVHASTVERFESSVKTLARATSTSLTFTHVADIVPHGVLYLEKSSGKIQILTLPTSMFDSRGAHLTFPVQRDNAMPTSLLTRQFAVSVLESSYLQDILQVGYKIYLQYDGKKERFSAKLSDVPRELLMAKRRGANEGSLFKLTRTLTLLPSLFWSWEIFKANLDFTAMTGAWCEVCGKDGVACARCQGAYYCGKEHQVEDWKEHKSWCNKHRVAKAVS